MKKLICVMIALCCCLTGFALAEDTIPAEYAPVLEQIRKALAGDEDVLMDDNFNSAFYLDTMNNGTEVGWALMDLDGDGRPELLLGETGASEWVDGSLLDIWTVRDGQAMLLGRGWDRNRMYLTNEGDGTFGLYHEGSNSAFESVCSHGLIRNGQLVDVVEINIVTDMDTDAVTYYLGDYYEGNAPVIDEDTAGALISSWQMIMQTVELVPLGQ